MSSKTKKNTWTLILKVLNSNRQCNSVEFIVS